MKIISDVKKVLNIFLSIVILLSFLVSIILIFVPVQTIFKLGAAIIVFLLCLLIIFILSIVNRDEKNKHIYNDFFETVLSKYKRLIYPANYQSVEPGLISEIVSKRISSIQDMVSWKTIAGAILPTAFFLTVLTFLFGISVVTIYSMLQENSSDVSKSILFVIDNMLKGFLFDFLESYHLSLSKQGDASLVLQTFSFVIRTIVECVLIVGIVSSSRLISYHYIYKQKMRNFGSKYEFFYQFDIRMRGWISSIPSRVGDSSKVLELFEQLVLPYLWQNDGPAPRYSYRETVRLMEDARNNPENCGFDKRIVELLDMEIDLLENWKIPAEAKKGSGSKQQAQGKSSVKKGWLK